MATKPNIKLRVHANNTSDPDFSQPKIIEQAEIDRLCDAKGFEAYTLYDACHTVQVKSRWDPLRRSYESVTIEADNVPNEKAPETLQKWMAVVNKILTDPPLYASEESLAPSRLSRQILCPAYCPSPIMQTDRLRFMANHATATQKTIERHAGQGYRLTAENKREKNGARSDLIFVNQALNKKRVVEVKSARTIKEVYKIQAALYWQPCYDEVMVSNNETDFLLTPEYIQSAQTKARITRALLVYLPENAAGMYNPNLDVCPTCANTACPLPSNPSNARHDQTLPPHQ